MTANESSSLGEEMANGEKFPEDLHVKVSDELKQALREEAYERSEPGDRVSMAEIVRELLWNRLGGDDD